MLAVSSPTSRRQAAYAPGRTPKARAYPGRWPTRARSRAYICAVASPASASSTVARNDMTAVPPDAVAGSVAEGGGGLVADPLPHRDGAAERGVRTSVVSSSCRALKQIGQTR